MRFEGEKVNPEAINFFRSFLGLGANVSGV